jgi:hypothetical protein
MSSKPPGSARHAGRRQHTQWPGMDRRTALRRIAALPLAGLATHAGLPAPVAAVRVHADRQGQPPWTPLFNGTDLSGWETFLGRPHKTTDVPGLPRDERGEYREAIGVGRDPTGVFSIVQADGGPAIRISGQVYGALTTAAEYGDYHLRFDFKWGGRRWPPREDAIRDTGCCYHAVGPHGASYGFWMRSCELQIQEGDCGDFYSLAGVIVDAEAVRVDPANPKSDAAYRSGAPLLVGHTRRIVKDGTHEKPHGEWNRVDLYCVGQASAHAVNGVINMRLRGIRQPRDGQEVPLTRGRIQLQSEAAEVFYRNIAIRPLAGMPGSSAG